MTSDTAALKLIAWNVDGYDDDIHTYVSQLLQEQPAILFLSETKKKKEELLIYLNQFDNYHAIVNSHNPSKWHGVAMLIHKQHAFKQIEIDMNINSRSDSNESDPTIGRIIAIHMNNMNIIGTYTPNSGKHVDYRINMWDPAFHKVLTHLAESTPTLWMGDINVAHHDIDVSNPHRMQHYAGFRQEERQFLTKIFEEGWIDVWRQQHPNDVGYTWVGYSQRTNHGMRLDNMIVSQSFSACGDAFILSPSIASDHLPVGIVIKNIIKH